MRRTPCVLLVVVVVAIIAVLAAARASPIAAGREAAVAVSGPPPGLTPYGRTIWQLDALLHDTFGNRQVYEDYPTRGPGIGYFSTRGISDAQSVAYTYTFATAHHSAFRAVRPTHSPKVGTYGTGDNVPLKIGSAYITCGGGKWLYQRNGSALPGGDMWCSRTP